MRILVTGGAGFLGRGIARAIIDGDWGGVDGMTVYSRDEQKQHEMEARFPDAPIRYVLGDVTDEASLRLAIAGHDVVVHAAAVKYIPEAEHNVAETIRINVGGSINVLRAALSAGVECVVGISTDKAVDPVNTYGASKLLMERAFAEWHGRGGMRCPCVRYGNVVGSTGSVIPLFLRQAESGPVCVTDSTMTRFWLRRSQAIALIDYAVAVPRNYAPVYVPRLGAATMADVAAACNGGREWTEIGPRPGEKPHEALIGLHESVRTHGHLRLPIVKDSDPQQAFIVMPATTSPVPYAEQWSYTSDRVAVLDHDWIAAAIEEMRQEGEL